jgi:hypothetical protein
MIYSPGDGGKITFLEEYKVFPESEAFHFKGGQK